MVRDTPLEYFIHAATTYKGTAGNTYKQSTSHTRKKESLILSQLVLDAIGM